MAINSAETLKAYALRQLGEPVIKINVAPEQIQDALEHALEKFRMFNMDASFEDVILFDMVAGQSSYTLGNHVLDVHELLTDENMAFVNGEPTFNAYWDAMQEKRTSGGLDVVGIYTLREKMAMLKWTFQRRYVCQFNERTHILMLQPTPTESGTVGVRAEVSYSFDDYPDLWSHPWLKEYFVALVGVQWGSNLTKFTGVPLPGGSTLNGEGILNRFEEKVKALEEELIDKYSLPPSPMVG